MGRIPCNAALGLALFAGIAVAAEPIATRQTAFSIPFRVGQAANERERPVEVQLFVSDDQGANWRPYSRVRPDQTTFNFKADRDGQYWFLVRTKDASGRIMPDRKAEPELQVLVDTAQPLLQLAAVRGAAGEITVRFQAGDANLQASTLKIDYQPQAGEPWQAIAVDLRRARITADRCEGEVTFWPASAAGTLIVRAEIADRAGNRAVSQSAIGTSGNAERDAAGPAANLQLTPTPADAAHRIQRLPTTVGTPDVAAPLANLLNFNATGGSLGFSGDVASGKLTDIRREPGQTPPPRPFSNASAEMSSLPATMPGAASVVTPPPAARGDRARMVNSRSFELQYDVESVGPWGIRQVELWGTRDGGQTWSSFGVDNDNRSPLTANVEAEGAYGFRILVQGGNGLVETPPRSGDRPEILVGVDLTRPACQLTQVQQGAAERLAEVTLAWEATDQALASRPVSLLYSDKPEGPWTVIASGVENTGRYLWTLDNRVPDRVFLRLEVRDEAGNLGLHQTPEPIQLGGLRPRGRLLDVRPSQTTGAVQTYHFR